MIRQAILLICAAAYVAPAYGWDKDILVSTPNTSLVLSGNIGGDLRFTHYGANVEPSHVAELHATGAGMERPAYPAFGAETNTLTSLSVLHADGNPTTRLVLEDVDVTALPGGSLTTVTLTDQAYPMTVKLNYATHDASDVIETWAEITNGEKKTVTLRRMDSGFLPVRSGNVWLMHQHGTWGAEASVTSEPLSPGTKIISNFDGARNGQNDRAEVMLSLDGKPDEHSGRTIGAILCWSGNYKLRLHTDNVYCHNLMAGISDENSEYYLEPGATFVTPKLALTYSTDGMGGVSRNFHKWGRAGAIHGGDVARDVLLNSWEGVYLDVDEAKMDAMMRDFAALGGELFVMDDGWFGDKYPRTKDNSSLGDWVVDRRKLPSGIEGLIAEAKRNGLKFGIWIEPECTNTISELYEKHPDWVIQADNRDLRVGRGGTQLLLDMGNPDVQDFVFGVVDDLMTKYPELAYIKWDANVSMLNYGSKALPKDRQLQTGIAYHKGLEATLKRIRAKYPDLTIQACGSGGGRVNYGVMPYFDEIWVSDNTDALQRIYMQWGTSMFYPAMLMAQHVSASPNHQTHRAIPMKFRFDVAMTGRLGMEMRPSDMTDAEHAFAKKAIASYKRIRDVVQFGNLYRLISPYDGTGFASLMYVDEHADRAVFFAYKLDHYQNQPRPRFYMAGLDSSKNYILREINVPIGQQPSRLDGITVSGATLMNAGLEIPLNGEYASRVYELTAHP